MRRYSQGNAKKGRRARMLPAVSQKASSSDHLDSANVSAIERASFMEGLQRSQGNPLQSTAMEEDLEVLAEGRVNKGRAEKKDIPETQKTDAKQRGAAVKRKETERDGESEKEEQQQQQKKNKISNGGRVKARPEKGSSEGRRGQSDPSTNLQESNQPPPTASRQRLVGKKPAKVGNVRQTPAARPEKNRQMKKDKKRKSEADGTKSTDPQSQEESDSDAGQQRRKRVLSSDEDEVEDASWKPSPKKDKAYSLGRSKSRKSSLGSASAEPGKTKRVEQKKKRRQGGTELEVVLDAFLDFCDQYRESVESEAVKQSIDSFSSNVKEQLMEKISSYKELRVLKRENAKVGSLIRTKTQKLYKAKQELMRSERQEWLLQKEKQQLELRLADLRRSHSFLCDIRELNRRYLDHRHTHPKEKETYGASSLPALLLENKHIQGAERELGQINNQLEKRLKGK
ncbi:hypothetical protein PAMP_022991 [Pampus punctatissimus]